MGVRLCNIVGASAGYASVLDLRKNFYRVLLLHAKIRELEMLMTGSTPLKCLKLSVHKKTVTEEY